MAEQVPPSSSDAAPGENGRKLSHNGESLYLALEVDKKATPEEIRKSYRKLALRCHPDKNPGDEEAKEKFQLLQKVISILGDVEKRALYDQTGCTEDDALSGDAAESLKEFFRSMFKKVTDADIEEFEANYRGSDSEKKDLKDLYKKFKGNMDRLFCSMICSEEKLDSHRFKDVIDEAIAEGELKTTKAYQKWAKKVSETKAPTDPLVKRGKKKKQPGTDIVALITQRRDQRKDQFDSMFSTILSKHVGEAPPEPSEEEFEKARQRLDNKKSKKPKN